MTAPTARTMPATTAPPSSNQDRPGRAIPVATARWAGSISAGGGGGSAGTGSMVAAGDLAEAADLPFCCGAGGRLIAFVDSGTVLESTVTSAEPVAAGGGPPTNRGRGGGGGAAAGGGLTFGGESESSSSTASKAESPAVCRIGRCGEAVSPTVGSSDGASSPSLQLGGGLTITMPPHLGQAKIWPIAA